MQESAGWHTRADYARFLAIQYAARKPVELWLADHAPEELQPPVQTDAIVQDLEALGYDVPKVGSSLSVDATTDAAVLAVAWVIAGSALGNNAIAAEMRRDGHGDWPMEFLGGGEMLAFWKRLRIRLNHSPSALQIDSGTNAANAVFDHFLAHASAPAPNDTRDTHTADA